MMKLFLLAGLLSGYAPHAFGDDCTYRTGIGDSQSVRAVVGGTSAHPRYELFLDWFDDDGTLITGDSEKLGECTVEKRPEGEWAKCPSQDWTGWVLRSGSSFKEPVGDEIVVLANLVLFKVCP